jgi:hypothetical protein
MTKLELGVLPSGHLQLLSTEDDSDTGQKTGQAVIANAFAQGIAEGLIALAAKDNAANLSSVHSTNGKPHRYWKAHRRCAAPNISPLKD